MDYLRKSVLELKKRVGLTEEAYFLLKELKKIKKQSMAQIACDLIKKEYGQNRKTKKETAKN